MKGRSEHRLVVVLVHHVLHMPLVLLHSLNLILNGVGPIRDGISGAVSYSKGIMAIADLFVLRLKPIVHHIEVLSCQFLGLVVPRMILYFHADSCLFHVALEMANFDLIRRLWLIIVSLILFTTQSKHFFIYHYQN